MIILPFTRDKRTTVWITAGLVENWRVTSATLTYGEFADARDAREFLRLLLLGNPERLKRIDG